MCIASTRSRLLTAPCVLYTLFCAATFAHIKNVPFVRCAALVCTSFLVQIIFLHLLFRTHVPQSLQPSFLFSLAYIHILSFWPGSVCRPTTFAVLPHSFLSCSCTSCLNYFATYAHTNFFAPLETHIYFFVRAPNHSISCPYRAPYLIRAPFGMFQFF